MAFEYHWPGDFQALGEKIKAKAISVTMSQADSYAKAQQAANNDATRYDTGQQTAVSGYTRPAGGAPDDDGNLRTYVEEAYASIPALFASFGLPNPDGSRPIVDALYKVAASVQVDLTMTADANTVAAPKSGNALDGTAPIGDVVNLVKTHMKQWQGDASVAFEDYMSRTATAANLHREIALSMALATEVQLEINRRIITDIWEVGQKTLKALDGLDAWCPGANSAKAVALLTIGGAIAGVATVFLTEVTAGGYAVALGAVASQTGIEGWQGLATILGATSGLREEKVEIGGMTVPPIITGMQNALNRVTATADATSKQLADALTKYRSIVDANWNKLVLPAPKEFSSYSEANASQLRTQRGIFAN
jgi:hypothetical protein